VGVNTNHPDHPGDDPVRDPRLARLLEAAGGEEPPAALDAAILAAARREVGARPQIVGGGSAAEAPVPVVRAKRNWYVPVSIAAMLVMSASLVMVVHEEKPDEVVQPPRQASKPIKPAVAPAPAPAAETSAPVPSASNDKRDELRDATPALAQPKVEEKTVAVRSEAPAPAAEPGGVTAELSKKQRVERVARVEKAEPAADSARKDKATTATAREPEAMGSVSAVPATPAPAAPAAPIVAAPPPFAASEAVPPRVEAKAPAEPFPAQANRDAVQARSRSETDQAGGARDSAPTAPLNAPPAALNVPPAAAASAPRRAAPAAEVVAPGMAEGRAPTVARPPPPPPAPMAIRPDNSATLRAQALRGLEDQPPEKWLEREAEFKRDGRLGELAILMVEFRRRFPDHPANVR
jgi:hypothetical protein